MKHFESNQDIVNAETRILTIGRTVTVNYTKDIIIYLKIYIETLIDKHLKISLFGCVYL